MEKLIRKESYDCPFCDEIQEIEVFKRTTKTLVEGVAVEHEEIYYYCPVEEEAFAPKNVLGQNLLAAKDAYRKMIGRLTSDEIKAIRQSYGLTQKEMSDLLGWGEITVLRYEKKAIQDETYDEKLKMVRDNPALALEELEKHKNRFSPERYAELKKGMLTAVKERGIRFLKIQVVESLYMDYSEPCDENGYTLLHMEKVEEMMCFFVQYVDILYKVKLMKLLWYADALHFKKYGRSISGLVYRHLPFGAVPLGYEEVLLVFDDAISIEENYVNDYLAYKIKKKRNADLSKLEPTEISVMLEVSEKFKHMGSKEISAYMHNEVAYKETKENEIIPYRFAKALRDF